jgi:hypothetical protein
MRAWLTQNQTLVIFLVVQALAIVTYSVRLETRVTTLEVRGSPHLTVIDNRLTVLESQTKSNKESIERVVDVMTRGLSK